MNAYLVAILSVTMVYVLLGLGLNLQWGHAGLLNFGHVAFFAIGAYTYALMALHGVPLVLDFISGAITAFIAAVLVARLTIGLKDDYLAIVTLALAQIVQLVLTNAGWSGGSAGLVGIPTPFSTSTAYFIAIVLVVVVSLVLLSRITHSPYGLSLQAIRDDSVAAGSIGKGVLRYKWRALAMGAALAGLGGAFYASYITFISPDQFSAIVTFYVVVGIVLGGTSHWGAMIGTFVFAAVEEATRFASDFGIPISDAHMANLRLFVIGAGLILLLRFRPQGLFPYRRQLDPHARARAERVLGAQAPAPVDASATSSVLTVQGPRPAGTGSIDTEAPGVGARGAKP